MHRLGAGIHGLGRRGLIVVLVGLAGDDSLRWSPYPLRLPEVSALACAAVLLLVVPAFVPPPVPARREAVAAR